MSPGRSRISWGSRLQAPLRGNILTFVKHTISIETSTRAWIIGCCITLSGISKRREISIIVKQGLSFELASEPWIKGITGEKVKIPSFQSLSDDRACILWYWGISPARACRLASSQTKSTRPSHPRIACMRSPSTQPEDGRKSCENGKSGARQEDNFLFFFTTW